ncbi:uncharacterized protein LOC119743505 [Patiria miniata]|uniref:Uncharacterized protein n=1 Tax=Patiria miniata TaxID=46514 RepID=A0A914BJ49_PATMI|nr:uncharacterized protein LOC119743505 [Patiria miniata]
MPVKVDELDYRREKKMPRKPGPTPEHFTPSKMIKATSIANIQDHLKKVCEESHSGALFLTLANDPPVAQSPVLVPSVKDLYQQYQASSQDGSFVDYFAANTTWLQQ